MTIIGIGPEVYFRWGGGGPGPQVHVSTCTCEIVHFRKIQKRVGNEDGHNIFLYAFSKDQGKVYQNCKFHGPQGRGS